MGIYPDQRWWSIFNRRSRDWDPRSNKRPVNQTAFFEWSEPGIKVTQVWEMICEIEERTNCFCCSCGDGGSDAACRNHGFAAKRPCELHNMPGAPWEDGTMPMPVNPKYDDMNEPGEAQISG